MPNYTMTKQVTDDMIAVAKILTKRRLDLATQGFPLLHDQVQAGVLPEKWRAQILEMHADGIMFFTDRAVVLTLEGANITRSARINVITKEHFIMPAGYHTRNTFHLSILPDPEREALVEWTNTAVHTLRLKTLVDRIVTEFLVNHAETVAHVHARWPGLVLLATLVEKELETGIWDTKTAKKTRAEIRQRFAQKPRSLSAYEWSLSPSNPGRIWQEKHRKAMKLAETTLVGASMLPKPAAAANVTFPVVTITSWTPLPGDPDKPAT